MTRPTSLLACTILFAATLAGCTQTPSAAVETARIDPSTQPSQAFVSATDFDELWNASDDVARSLLFKPDRQDRRSGTLQTEPMTSSQWFEPWRRELKSADAVAQSSLATVRRTLTVQITKDPASNTFRATPSILVERYARTGSRITNSARYRQVYQPNRSTGSAERDRGVLLPNAYWYPIGNDPDLERDIAARIQKQLNG